MDLHVAWQHRGIWAKVLATLLVLSLCIYLTKTSHSAVYEGVVAPSSSLGADALTEGELSLLTYNVAGLPEIISAAESPRAASIKEISKRVNDYDIVNVQEDFHYHRELYDSGNEHPYRTRHKEAIPYGDGLNTMSKYPIIQSDRVGWADCHGSDCLAAKGFSMVRLQLAQGITIDVYNVHATSQDNVAAASARRNNLKQLAAYINKHSKGEALLVMGDFNAHYAASWDSLNDFVATTNLQDGWLHTMKNGRVPAVVANFVAQEKLSITDSCESIDKILFRNSPFIEFTPRSYKIEKQQFSNSNGQSLSDHCAVSLSLAWKVRQNARLLQTGYVHARNQR